MDTMPSLDTVPRRPTPEVLVEVRTPAEVAASPDGTRLAFSLRRLFLVDVESGGAAEVGPPGLCVWESDWGGDATVVATVSEDPMANGWYGARIVRLDLEARTATTLLSPSGRWRASCSRRTGGAPRSSRATRAIPAC